MAAPRNAATPDRHGRILLVAVVVMTAVLFAWLITALAQAAFG